MKKICVLGLGYIGLPTSSILATHGFEVTGVDINTQIVQIVNRGGLPIKEPGLKTIVKAAVNSGNLHAQPEPKPSDIFIIAVPTPITEEKKVDLSYIEQAANSIVPFLDKGNLVVLESTSPPGTTQNLLAPLLEKTGMKAGEDFFVAYCPERVLPGRILKELIENNRVIGGIESTSALEAKKLYSSFVEGEIYLTDSTTAEMVKLMENTYRDVNIALANELAVICNKIGINSWDVIKLANLHPRVNLHNPGPGVGGHCLAVDPWFIVEKFPEETKIISSSRNINDSMPHYVAEKITGILNICETQKVTIAGVTYKANIDDTRNSPVLNIIKYLLENKIYVAAYDPHVKDFEYELVGLVEAFRNSDLAVITTGHEEFKYFNPQELGQLMRHRSVFDTCNCLDHKLWQNSGFEVLLLGAGGY